ncbi:hypothetical protein [Nostoc sp. LPT]|uniref:hypothetical protein n=1 Tax=Nostoc sp. LPT TaxID=2815387 RepID=UPI001DDAE146|nr:hypothetical protein [Nostoc sp. LPT]MBN4005132.1 hypothetical protein [Nostoc sp. LPT]
MSHWWGVESGGQGGQGGQREQRKIIQQVSSLSPPSPLSSLSLPNALDSIFLECDRHLLTSVK